MPPHTGEPWVSTMHTRRGLFLVMHYIFLCMNWFGIGFIYENIQFIYVEYIYTYADIESYTKSI